MRTLEQAEAFAGHLRLVGIEATCRRWGKRKNWLCINIAGTDFLWKEGGDYDGWDRYVGDASEEEVGKLLDEANTREKQRRARGGGSG